MQESLSILILENDLTNLTHLTTELQHLQTQSFAIKITAANTLDEAILILADQGFDIIITELFLPDSQGLDTLLEIQKRADAIPIIIMGAATETDMIHNAIKLGAQDYLPKSDVAAGLLSRIIRYAIERNRLHASLRALSFTDELTGAYNRRGFITLVEQQISLAKRTRKGFYLFIVDLDYLKHINDTYGHRAGDYALVHTVKCLNATFRRHDIVGRIGGDEFAIVAINATRESGDYLKQHMLDKLKEYNRGLNIPYKLSFSIGRAYFDSTQALNLDQLLQLADRDLYHSKKLSHKNS